MAKVKVPDSPSLDGDPPPPKPSWRFTYRAKLITCVIGLVVFTGAIVSGLSYHSNQANTTALAHALFREVSGHAVTHTQSFLLRAVPMVESLVPLADQGLAVDDSDRLAEQLLAILKANPGLSWISYGDENGGFTGVYRPAEGGLRTNQSHIVEGRTRLLERDVLPDGSRQVFRQEENSGYDPRHRPYYVKAKQEGRLVWSLPYIFYNQHVPGISCAAPVFDSHRQLRGVLSVDFDLNSLSDFVSQLHLSEHATVFLFTADEVLLAHPALRLSSMQAFQSTDKLRTLAEVDDPLVQAYRAKLQAGASRDDFQFFEFGHNGTGYLGSATTFRVGNDLTWVVGALAPKDDFLAGVWRSQVLALVGATAALLIAILLAVWMARWVSGPVLELIGFMHRVGAGELDARADFRGSLEFQQLSEAVNHMIADLRDRVQLRHSLNLAMEVQQRLLPQKPPQIPGLDVTGHSTYCDETGGDYYDYLVLDKAAPHQLLLAMGDVMGHGVAAALVMAGARAVLRDRANAAGTLTDWVGRLNRMLATDHQGERFMTMHLAILDSRTGIYRWVSAGHDPAILYDASADRFEELKAGNMPLGIMEELEYTEHTCGPLKPGTLLFVGTDGVWEARNAQGQQFGKERLRQFLRGAAQQSAEKIVSLLRERLRAFTGDAKPMDDITFVIVKILRPTEGISPAAKRTQ